MPRMKNGYVTNRAGTFTELVTVRAVTPLEGFDAQVVFTDGTARVINLEKYLKGPIFEPIRNDPAMFRSMRVENDTISWPNEADIDPDTLYYEGPPPWAQVETGQRGAYQDALKKKPARALREHQAQLKTPARPKPTKTKATKKGAAHKTTRKK